MSKDALVSRVADATGLTKKAAAEAVDATIAAINDIVGAGGSLRLPPLGTFSRKHKAARTGRNPQTGETIHISARDVIVFKQSKAG